MARKLIVEIVGDSRSYERALGRSAKATQGFNSSIRGLGATTAAFAKRAAVAGAAITGLAAVTGVKFVQAASSLNEEVNKTTVIFGQSADGLLDWSKTTANALGLSQRAALEATGNFGNMFATLGLGTQTSADMSKRLVRLGADLASFSNQDPEEMLTRLRSGLAGEAEPLRRFGILLSEARVTQEAMRLGLVRTGEKLTEQQKVQARYSLILQDSATAQGDFARTSDSLANSQRRVRALFEDSAATIGQAFLPIAARALNALAGFIPSIQRGLQGAGRAIAGPLQAAMTQVNQILVPAVQALVDTIGSRVSDLRAIFTSVMTPLRDNVLPVIRDVGGLLLQTWSNVVATFSSNSERIRTVLTNLGESLRNVWTVARPTVVFLFTKVLPVALAVSIRVLEKVTGVVKVLSQIFVRTVSVIVKALDVLLGAFTQLTDAASHLPVVGDQFAGVSDKINAARENLRAFAGGLDALDGQQIEVGINIAVDTTTGRREEGALGRQNTNKRKIQDAVDDATETVQRQVAGTTAITTQADNATTAAKTATTAADRATNAFDRMMAALQLKLDRAQVTRTFRDDIAVLKAIQQRIKDRIREVGRTTELSAQLFQASQDLAAAQREQRKARQLEALGLTPEGERPVPGSGALLRRAKSLLVQLKGTPLDTAENRRQLRRIIRVLKANFKTAGREVRQAILDMLNDITGAGDGAQAQGPLTKTTGLVTKKIVAGIGLSEEEKRAIRGRLSKFNSQGRAIAGGTNRSQPGMFVADRPIVVNTTVNIDGKKVATNTTRHQQRDRRRNPRQKRGPARAQ